MLTKPIVTNNGVIDFLIFQCDVMRYALRSGPTHRHDHGV